jgi:hypothetical protein
MSALQHPAAFPKESDQTAAPLTPPSQPAPIARETPPIGPLADQERGTAGAAAAASAARPETTEESRVALGSGGGLPLIMFDQRPVVVCGAKDSGHGHEIVSAAAATKAKSSHQSLSVLADDEVVWVMDAAPTETGFQNMGSTSRTLIVCETDVFDSMCRGHCKRLGSAARLIGCNLPFLLRHVRPRSTRDLDELMKAPLISDAPPWFLFTAAWSGADNVYHISGANLIHTAGVIDHPKTCAYPRKMSLMRCWLQSSLSQVVWVD